MRVFASYLAGLLTLVMLLAAGGAWTESPRPTLVAVTLDPSAAAERFHVAVPVPTTTSTTAAELPPGCRPPLRGAECVPVAVAGALDLPFDYHDLIPETIDSIDDWRPLVAAFFEPRHVELALRVLRCESRGNPTAKNPTSSASGLFQHLGSLWPERAADAGWQGNDVFDPVANTAVAAWLVYHGGGWSHWAPSRSCWG